MTEKKFEAVIEVAVERRKLKLLAPSSGFKN